jgi:hypothetical protein
LRNWRVPNVLDEIVAYQIEPWRCPDFPKEAAVLHVASDIAFHMAPDIKSRASLGECQLSFDEAAWNLLGLERGVLVDIMQVSLVQAFELLEIVNRRG